MLERSRISLLFTFFAVVANGCAFLNANYAAVEPQRFYRSGQMHPEAFERALDDTGAKTVICLRSAAPGDGWYDYESALADERGLDYYSLGWSKDRLPAPGELNDFIRIVDENPAPILVHCQGGVHRASAASAIYVLLEGGTIEDARAQLVRGFNKARVGDFLDGFAESNKPFRQWVHEDYAAFYAAHAGATG